MQSTEVNKRDNAKIRRMGRPLHRFESHPKLLAIAFQNKTKLWPYNAETNEDAPFLAPLSQAMSGYRANARPFLPSAGLHLVQAARRQSLFPQLADQRSASSSRACRTCRTGIKGAGRFLITASQL
jgi:hypothetical protein